MTIGYLNRELPIYGTRGELLNKKGKSTRWSKSNILLTHQLPLLLQFVFQRVTGAFKSSTKGR